MEIAGLDQSLNGFGERRLHALLLVLRFPRRMVLEILSVVGDLSHQGRHGFVGYRDKALRSAFGAARVAINFDEAVGEVDGGIVAHPIDVKLQPVLRIAGLVVADQIADRLGLLGLGDFSGMFQIRIRFGEIFSVQSRRHAMIGRARSIDLFHQLPIHFRQPRVQRIALREILDLRQRHAGVEIVRAGLQDVEPFARALGGDHRLEVRIEQRLAQFVEDARILARPARAAACSCSNVKSGKNFCAVVSL